MSNRRWANKAKMALLVTFVGSVLGGCWARVHDGHDRDHREGDHEHHEDHRDDRH